jgi:hypothetical protein
VQLGEGDFSDDWERGLLPVVNKKSNPVNMQDYKRQTAYHSALPMFLTSGLYRHRDNSTFTNIAIPT